MYPTYTLIPTPKPISLPPPKQILSGYTHKNREDRISQRVWYENITYPGEVREALTYRSKQWQK